MTQGTQRPALWKLGSARGALLVVFLIYFALYTAANWPAMSKAWWYSDDYDVINLLQTSTKRLVHEAAMISGRPGQAALLFTFALDGQPDHQAANILLRFGQAATHVLWVALAAWLIWKVSRRWLAVLALLPLLLWPFNAEAVIWRSAISYPFAALLSVAGAYVLRQARPLGWLHALVGLLLLAAAMLTNQAAGFAGLLIWVFALLSAVLCRGEVPPKSRLAGEAAVILAGYGIGGVVSVTIARALGSERAQFAGSVVLKARLLAKLVLEQFWWPGYYPDWLSIVLGLFAALAFAGLAWSLIRRKWSRLQTLSALALLGLCFVVPFVGDLVAAGMNIPWRGMYLGPVMFAAFLFVGYEAFADLAVPRLALLAVLGATLAGYVIIAWPNAADYPATYAADRAILQDLSGFAAQTGENKVHVVTTSQLSPGTWNPYRVRYFYLDSKLSAFYVPWSAHAFVSWLSPTLSPVTDEKTTRMCINTCKQEPNPELRFRFRLPQPAGPACVCLP